MSDELIVHPTAEEFVRDVAEGIRLRAIMFEKVRNRELQSGFIFDMDFDTQLPSGSFEMPDGVSISAQETFIRRHQCQLTEFGSYYVALFITGMFCRYFPDVWMKHLAAHTELSVLVEHLCNEAKDRLPLLILSELDQIAYLRP